MRLPLHVCALLTLTACAPHSRQVSDEFVPRPVVAVDQWQVQSAGKDLGFVVLLEIQDPSGPIRFYRVENLGHQWMGHVALDGRFSRRVPFKEEEEDLGIYSMNRGLAVLYQVEGPVQLIPVEGAASEASVPRVGRQ